MPQDVIGYRNREELINYTRLRLGDGMVDVELDREHYDMAIDNAMSMYRRLSSGAVQKSYIHLQCNDNVVKYTLPDEEVSKWTELAGEPLWKQWVSDREAEGYTEAQEILDTTLELIKTYNP